MSQNTTKTWNYDDYKKLIFTRLNRFCLLNNCNTDEDELLIEAQIAFIRATRTWEEGKMKFASYLCVCVDRAMRDFWDAWKKQPRGQGGEKSRLMDEHEYSFRWRSDEIADRHHFDISLFLNEVSEDAREVIQVVLTQPGRVNANTRKNLLKNTLKDMGWTSGRIAQCWKEIREALS